MQNKCANKKLKEEKIEKISFKKRVRYMIQSKNEKIIKPLYFVFGSLANKLIMVFMLIGV